MRKFIAIIFILLLLVGLAYAGDIKKEDKKVDDVVKDKNITDATKETSKEIKKDSGIKVKDTASEISKYKYFKDKNKITISKNEAKDKKGKQLSHTKTVLTLDEKTARSIDLDKDEKFGMLRRVDGEVVESKVVTLKELTTGVPATFSEWEINGFSGSRTTTFYNVTSGTTLNIQDGSPDAVTVAVSGSVPTYTAMNESNKNSYPSSVNLKAAYPLNGNAADITGNYPGTATGIKWNSTYAYMDGVTGRIATFNPSTAIGNGGNFSVFLEYMFPTNDGRNVYSGYGVPRFYLQTTATPKYKIGYDNILPEVNVIPATNVRQDLVITFDTNSNIIHMYKDGTQVLNYNSASTEMFQSERISLGGVNTYKQQSVWKFGLYNKVLNIADVRTLYAGGSGISFQPEPSYNFTGYNVASGVAKTLNIDSTVTGIEVVNTAGTTLDSVTVVEYFTNDTYIITDSNTSTLQTVNISMSSPAIVDEGRLVPYEILDGYDGTIIFNSTNPNATISRNETHFVIDTGYLPANVTYYYLVQIPNLIEEMLWYDWDPTNETCNAKVQIGNSTPYTTWNITTYNVTAGNVYSLYNPLTLTNAFYRLGTTQASLICTNLSDQEYWIKEQEYLPGTMVNITYRKTSGGWEPTSTSFGSSVPISSYTQVTVS